MLTKQRAASRHNTLILGRYIAQVQKYIEYKWLSLCLTEGMSTLLFRKPSPPLVEAILDLDDSRNLEATPHHIHISSSSSRRKSLREHSPSLIRHISFLESAALALKKRSTHPHLCRHPRAQLASVCVCVRAPP